MFSYKQNVYIQGRNLQNSPNRLRLRWRAISANDSAILLGANLKRILCAVGGGGLRVVANLRLKYYRYIVPHRRMALLTQTPGQDEDYPSEVNMHMRDGNAYAIQLRFILEILV